MQKYYCIFCSAWNIRKEGRTTYQALITTISFKIGARICLQFKSSHMWLDCLRLIKIILDIVVRNKEVFFWISTTCETKEFRMFSKPWSDYSLCLHQHHEDCYKLSTYGHFQGWNGKLKMSLQNSGADNNR